MVQSQECANDGMMHTADRKGLKLEPWLTVDASSVVFFEKVGFGENFFEIKRCTFGQTLSTCESAGTP